MSSNKNNYNLTPFRLIYDNKQFVLLVSFLQGRLGIGYTTLTDALFPDMVLSKQQISVVNKWFERFSKLNRNEVLLYTELPFSARKRIFDQNQKEVKDTEYILKSNFELFDRILMPKLVLFEENMLDAPRRTLSKVFNVEFTIEQKEGLDNGEWIKNYNQATHSYKKWLGYQKKAYVLIKQEITYQSYFRSYLLLNK